MGKMKLYNRDSEGFVSPIPNGGMPAYLEDLEQLEQNSQLWGFYTMLKGWSCILGGGKVTNVNVTASTCNVDAMFVLLNNVVYYVPKLVNQTYPFSIVKGTETIEQRLFEQSGVQDTGVNYDYGIKTNFSYDTTINLYYPINITTEEVFFNPFCAQHATRILQNLGKSKLSTEQTLEPSSVVSLDEDEQNLIGGTFPKSNDIYLKWWNFNYIKFIPTNNTLLGISNNFVNAGLATGSNSLTITKPNIPSHTHHINIVTDTQGLHTHNLTYAEKFNAGDGESGGAKQFGKGNGQYPDGNIYSPTQLRITQEGNHQHTVSGDTDAGGLSATPTPLSLNPSRLNLNVFVWQGYKILYKYDVATNTNIQVNYKFWSDNVRIPNM